MIKFMPRILLERQLMIATLLGHFESFPDELEKSGADKELLKSARMTRTYAKKTLDLLMKNADYRQIELVQSEIRKYSYVLRYKKQALTEYKQQSKMEENVLIKADTFDMLCNHAKASCAVCESVGNEITSCSVYKLFLEHGVQVENPQADISKRCPFRIGKE